MTVHLSTCKVHKRSAPNFKGPPPRPNPQPRTASSAQPELGPYNLTVISHQDAVALVGGFFSRKGCGRLGERDQGFSFLLHERETTQAPEAGAGVWELFLGAPSPSCTPHAVLLTSASSWASRERPRRGNASRPDSPPIRGPDSGGHIPRAISDTGGLVHLRGKLARNRSSPRDSPRFFPSRAASDFETWNLNGSAVLFSRQAGCSCPASR